METSREKKTSKIMTKTRQQIDEILDKISQSGYDSLTKRKNFCLKLESIFHCPLPKYS
jgi:hypothetical protein